MSIKKEIKKTENETIMELSLLNELNRHADDIGLVCERILDKLDSILSALEMIENHLRYSDYGGGKDEF